VTLERRFITVNSPIYFAKFLDDDYIVVLGDCSIYVISIESGKITTYKTERFHVLSCHLMFVSQNGKICIVKTGLLDDGEEKQVGIYETKLSMDNELKWNTLVHKNYESIVSINSISSNFIYGHSNVFIRAV
jgi:hypothetical protein